MVRRFLESGRSGLYLSVIREGMLAPGDTIDLVSAADHDVTVADVAASFATGGEYQNLLRRVIAVKTLPAGLKDHLEGLLD